MARQVLMLIDTAGLDYDDRLRKESLSLRDMGYEVVIAAMESANEAGQRIVYDHIPATTIHLASRGWFARRTGLAVKATEMYLKFLRLVWRHRPDILWFHNFEMIAVVPILALLRKIGLVKRLVWDQHELFPDGLLANKKFLWLLSRLYNGCDVLISANVQRKQWLEKLLGDSLRTPIQVLDNYPDRLFVEAPARGLPQEVSTWLAGRPYVLAQGGAGHDRHPEELVSAMLGIPDVGLIMIGPYREATIQHLRQVHGGRFDEGVYLTGFIPQMDIVPYIDHALLSIVLYEMSNQNLRLSAPNRLYQAVSRGIPVVVGANPTMADFVRQWECGVALKTDGSDDQDIRSGILETMGQLDRFRYNAIRCQDSITWESQLPTIAAIAQAAAKNRSGSSTLHPSGGR